MKNKKLLLALVLILGASALFGATSTTVPSYTTALDGIDKVGTSGTTIIKSFGKMFLTLVGWGLMLGFPAGAYYAGLSYFKKQDERNDSSVSASLTHAKAGFMAIIGAFAGSMLFIMIFFKLLHLDQAYGTVAQPANSGTVVKKVLGL